MAENRRFYLVDTAGDRVGALEFGKLLSIDAEFDAADDRLTLRLPSGDVVEGRRRARRSPHHELLRAARYRRIYGLGPWSEALSGVAGRPLRIDRTDEPGVGVDREDGTVSLVSEASLAELALQAGHEGSVDGRRFRMLVGVTGCRAHEEDEWIGRDVQVGEAVVRSDRDGRALRDHDPEPGNRRAGLRHPQGDQGLPRAEPGDDGARLRRLRDVVRPGHVRVGDPVQPL